MVYKLDKAEYEKARPLFRALEFHLTSAAALARSAFALSSDTGGAGWQRSEDNLGSIGTRKRSGSSESATIRCTM
jgi:hypothetical protein